VLKYAVDEDFNHEIIRGLALKDSGLDFLTVQDVDLLEVHDREILAWAAQERRILLTHDVRTMPMYAAERLRERQAMPGLVLVPQSLPIGRAIDDLLLIAQCSQEDEYEGMILRLPL
jgi:Domain of unknown function (DUF5615)